MNTISILNIVNIGYHYNDSSIKMKIFNIICIFLGLMSFSSIYAQDEQILVNPEVSAVYPDGEEELLKFIAKNFNYTFDQNTIATKFYFRISIDTFGVASFDTLLTNYVHDDKVLVVKELTRVVNLMPKWKPSEFYGKKVESKMNIPLKIELQ